MKKSLRIIVFALLCAASYTACQRASEEKKTENRLVSADSLNKEYKSLSDSAVAHWKVMIADDDQKLADMRRLLQEISYFPLYNKAKLDSLNTQLQQVYEMRFQPETMTSEQIDSYDSASAALKAEIIRFAEEHPDVEKYPLVDQLIDSIETADQRVIIHRVKYDNYAHDLNAFMLRNREFVRKIDTTGFPEKMPLFRLEE